MSRQFFSDELDVAFRPTQYLPRQPYERRGRPSRTGCLDRGAGTADSVNGSQPNPLLDRSVAISLKSVMALLPSLVMLALRSAILADAMNRVNWPYHN